MSVLADTDDGGLLTRVREGDSGAMAELWSRHYPATLAAARRISRQPRDAEELASDAFSAMLQALSHDAGPTTSVRAYLMTAVRNQATSRARRSSAGDVLTDEIAEYEDAGRDAYDPVAHHAELGLVRQAFASLPRRWQTVLWRTAVDHDGNKVIAADLDMSPNAVAALVRRARMGFRTAYIQVHASTHDIPAECEPFVPRLVELLPSSRTRRGASADVRAHVDRCEECARRLVAFESVDKDLRAILLPALLGLGPGISWVTGGPTGHAVGALWFKMAHGPKKVRHLAGAGATAAVVAAGSLSAYAVTQGDQAPSPSASTHSAAQRAGEPAPTGATPGSTAGAVPTGATTTRAAPVPARTHASERTSPTTTTSSLIRTTTGSSTTSSATGPRWATSTHTSRSSPVPTSTSTTAPAAPGPTTSSSSRPTSTPPPSRSTTSPPSSRPTNTPPPSRSTTSSPSGPTTTPPPSQPTTTSPAPPSPPESSPTCRTVCTPWGCIELCLG